MTKFLKQIISMLKSRGVDERILENPAGRKTLLEWAHDSIRIANNFVEVDFNDYSRLYGAINLHIRDGKVIDDYGVRNRAGILSRSAGSGEDLSTRELLINENGELQLDEILTEEDIIVSRSVEGNPLQKEDKYYDYMNKKTSTFDKNGLQISEEFVSSSSERNTDGTGLPKYDKAYGYKLERGKTEKDILIGNYTVYDNLMPGDAFIDGKIREASYTNSATTAITLEGENPQDLGGRRPKYDEVVSDLQEIKSFDDAKKKGYAIAFNNDEVAEMNSYYAEQTEAYKEKSSIFKKSFEDRSGISNNKDIQEIEE